MTIFAASSPKRYKYQIWDSPKVSSSQSSLNNRIKMFINFKFCFLVLALLAAVRSSPVYEDQQGAASGDDYGRVQIKVFRGPSEGGYDSFAPWGYWVKQPADDHH